MLLTPECEEYLTKSLPFHLMISPKAKYQKSDTPSDAPSSSLWNLYSKMLADVEEAHSDCGCKAEMIVKMYLKETVQSGHTGPLNYWKQKPEWPSSTI